MSKSRFWVWIAICCIANQLLAQDSLPNYPVNTPVSQPMHGKSIFSDTLSFCVTLPAAFTGVGRNVMTDKTHALSSFFERLRLVKEGVSEDSVRIVHIGDSHIRGSIYPQTVGDHLQEAFGRVSYADMGVNGATCLTFTDRNKIADIAAMKPEFLILSLGTNESHNRGYTINAHYQQIKDFFTLLRDSLPTIPILLTTPPGSYEVFRQRRRRHSYAANLRTSAVAGVIRNFGADHQLAVWDLYSIVGGSQRACKNWQAAGLLRPDHVHYMPQGYVLQGELLYEALIKAYNDYVSH